MRVVSKHWLRGLLLTVIYLLGLFGIVASGGGSGGGESVSITKVHINKFFFSSTYDSKVFLSGSFTIESEDEAQFSRTVTITWRNQLTGESGSSKTVIKGTCTPIPFPPWIACSVHGDVHGYDEFDISVPLDIGSNEITVTVSMKGSEAQDSVTVIRTPPDGTVLPHVETQPATDLGFSSAKLHGLVNPNMWAYFETAEVWFEYSTDPGLEPAVSTTKDQLDGVINANVAVSATISSLEDGTNYFYRLVARNRFGTVRGATLNFTAPLLPTVLT